MRDDPPRREEGSHRRPVRRRPGCRIRKARHQQGGGDGDGVRPPVGGGVRRGGEDEEARGRDNGGGLGVIWIYFYIISVNIPDEYRTEKQNAIWT